jgi:hypothetical protein
VKKTFNWCTGTPGCYSHLWVISIFQIISLRRYRDKLLDFTMAEVDPKITIEQTPTRTNNEDMSNIVHEDISDCSNSIPAENFDFSKEGGLILVFTTVFRDRASFSRF